MAKQKETNMTNSIELRSTAKDVLLMVKANEVSKEEGKQFLGARIEKKLNQAMATGEIWMLATKYTYDAFNELSGLTDDLMSQHKLEVKPDYDKDFYKKQREAKKAATTNTSDKPEKTPEELAAYYATRSVKQLENWLSKANPDGIKYPLIQAAIAAKKSGEPVVTKATTKKTPVKKVTAKKAAPVETTTNPDFAAALEQMKTLAGDTEKSPEERAAFLAVINSIESAKK